MINIINKVSHAVRNNRPRKSWAVQIAIALGFVVIASSFYIYQGVTQRVRAQTITPDFTVLLNDIGGVKDNNWPVEPYSSGGTLLNINIPKTVDSQWTWNEAYFQAGIYNPLTDQWQWYAIAAKTKAELTHSDPDFSYYRYQWKPGYDMEDKNLIPRPSGQVVIAVTLMNHLGSVIGTVSQGRSVQFALAKMSFTVPNQTTNWALEESRNIEVRFATPPVKSLDLKLGILVNGDDKTAGSPGEFFFASLRITGGGFNTYFKIPWNKVGYALNGGIFSGLPSDKVQLWSRLYYLDPATNEIGGKSCVFVISSPPPADVARVEITPATATVEAGVDQLFTAIAYDTAGQEMANSTDSPLDFTWSGTTGDHSGIFNQTIAKDYPVTVTYGSKIATVTITVIPGPVNRVEIRWGAPGDPATAGYIIAIDAAIFDEYGNQINVDPTEIDWSGTQWPHSNHFMQTAAGIYPVSASYQGVDSNIWEIRVVAGEAASVRITPSEETFVGVGHDLQFYAEVLDQFGNFIGDHPLSFTWSGTNGLGLFNQTVAGSYSVNATYTGAPGNHPISPTTTVFVSETALSGIYFSKKFDMDADEALPVGIKSLGTLTADYYQPTGTNFVDFKIKFYDTAGNPVPASGGEYSLNVAESGVGVDMDNLFKQYTWFDQIAQIQFVIAMSTDNYLDSSRVPWVQSLTLNYELNAAEVGIINFTGETNKTATQGASVDYDLVAVPLAGSGTGFVRAVLAVDWNGAEAGNGTKPLDMIVQFLIDGQLTNDSGNIWEFWLDENNQNYRPSGYPFQLKLTSGNNTPPEVYAFHVVGSVFGDTSRTLRRTSNPGVLTVTGGVVPTGDFSLEFVGEHVISVRPGNPATYQFLVKSINNFSGLVALSTDIITGHKFATGAIASATFDRASVTPTPEGNSVILSIGVSATALEEGPHTFAITGTATGTAGSIVHDINPSPLLQIDNEAPEQPEITVNATVTMEGTRGTEQPRFFFYLYLHDAITRAAKVFRKTDILPGEFAGEVVSIVVLDGLVTVGEQYTGYLRSTRHLWKKSTSDIDINATTTTYSMAFGSSTSPMLSGNVGPTPDASSFLDDDIINSLDFLTVFQEWAGIWLTRFADFDNNGVVNSIDLPTILTHWGQRGDLLTNLPN